MNGTEEISKPSSGKEKKKKGKKEKNTMSLDEFNRMDSTEDKTHSRQNSGKALIGHPGLSTFFHLSGNQGCHGHGKSHGICGISGKIMEF